jgi:hypothetical protein
MYCRSVLSTLADVETTVHCHRLTLSNLRTRARYPSISPVPNKALALLPLPINCVPLGTVQHPVGSPQRSWRPVGQRRGAHLDIPVWPRITGNQEWDRRRRLGQLVDTRLNTPVEKLVDLGRQGRERCTPLLGRCQGLDGLDMCRTSRLESRPVYYRGRLWRTDVIRSASTVSAAAASSS